MYQIIQNVVEKSSNSIFNRMNERKYAPICPAQILNLLATVATLPHSHCVRMYAKTEIIHFGQTGSRRGPTPVVAPKNNINEFNYGRNSSSSLVRAATKWMGDYHHPFPKWAYFFSGGDGGDGANGQKKCFFFGGKWMAKRKLYDMLW